MAEGRSNVEVLIQKDFSKFEPDVLAKLKGADGCIWAQVSLIFLCLLAVPSYTLPVRNLSARNIVSYC